MPSGEFVECHTLTTEQALTECVKQVKAKLATIQPPIIRPDMWGNFNARTLERQYAAKAVDNMIHEYLQGIPVNQWDIAETDRLYREARARVLYGA